MVNNSIEFNLTIRGETKYLVIKSGENYPLPRVYIYDSELDAIKDIGKVYLDTKLNLVVEKKLQYPETLKFLSNVIESYDYLEDLCRVIRTNKGMLDQVNRKKLDVNKKKKQIEEYIDSVQSWVNVQFREEMPEDF